MKTRQAELIHALEQLVDTDSLSDVILALARMCNEKSEHLVINWQNKTAAKEWDRAARLLDTVASKVDL